MRTAWICIIVLLLSTSVVFGQIADGRSLSLELDDVLLVSVLSMIASQHDLNLVISGDIEGNVTMRLGDVDLETALDALLTANGYSYFVRDDVIIVKPTGQCTVREMASRIVTLKYLDPITAKKALSARISQKGSIVILDKSDDGVSSDESYAANRLLITDFPKIVDELVAMIDEMDIAERSILIVARIIETTIDSKSNLGVSWPSRLSAKLSDAATSENSSETTTSTVSSGLYNPQNGDWTWSKLSVAEVDLVLNLLEQNGNSRLVSDPRITTLENHQAEFKFETIIPIQTINRFTEGAATSDIVTFEDEEIGISMKVIPRVNEEGRITLDIDQQVEDIIDYTGSVDNRKPITASRSIRTRVTVNDGETVALGGLLKEDTKEMVQRVPILGHIPLIGSFLFSSKSIEKTTTDLIILITPHIID